MRMSCFSSDNQIVFLFLSNVMPRISFTKAHCAYPFVSLRSEIRFSVASSAGGNTSYTSYMALRPPDQGSGACGMGSQLLFFFWRGRQTCCSWPNGITPKNVALWRTKLLTRAVRMCVLPNNVALWLTKVLTRLVRVRTLHIGGNGPLVIKWCITQC